MVREHSQKKTFTAVNAAKKMKSLARGYGSGARKGKGYGKNSALDGSYRISIESLKRRTRCSHCHEVGHWHKECPRRNQSSINGKVNTENAVHYMEAGSHEAMFIGYQDFLKIKQAALSEVPGSSSADAKDLAQHSQQHMPCVHRVHEAMFVEQVAFAEHARSIDEDLCATVDTGCQRTAVGSSTLSRMLAKQPKGLEAVIKPETHHFKSINGTTCTKHVACIPSSLGPKGCILRPAVFDEGDTKGAPFLLSLPFLLHCRAHLCLDPVQGLELYLSKYKHRIPLHIGPTGSLRVCLQDFQGDMKEDLAQALKSIAVHECSHMSLNPESDRLSSQPSASTSPPTEAAQHAHRLQAKPRGEGREPGSSGSVAANGPQAVDGASTCHAKGGLLQPGDECTSLAAQHLGAKERGRRAQAHAIADSDGDLPGQLRGDRRLHGHGPGGQQAEVLLRPESREPDHPEGGQEPRKDLPPVPPMAATRESLPILRVDGRATSLESNGGSGSLAGSKQVIEYLSERPRRPPREAEAQGDRVEVRAPDDNVGRIEPVLQGDQAQAVQRGPLQDPEIDRHAWQGQGDQHGGDGHDNIVKSSGELEQVKGKAVETGQAREEQLERLRGVPGVQEVPGNEEGQSLEEQKPLSQGQSLQGGTPNPGDGALSM